MHDARMSWHDLFSLLRARNAMTSSLDTWIAGWYVDLAPTLRVMLSWAIGYHLKLTS